MALAPGAAEGLDLDSRMLGVAAVMALGVTLLIPTFNALNNSYVEDVAPPPWMPTPDEIPPFTPPPDYKPPPDAEPPPGWEPPPGYEGPVPPVCPPPVARRLDNASRTQPPLAPQPRYFEEIAFVVPNFTLVMQGYVNFTAWRASSISVTLDAPEGGRDWTQSAQSSTSGGLLPSPTREQDTSWFYDSMKVENGQQPKPGEYRLTLSAQFPVDGQVETQFGVLLACGGLVS